MCTSIPFSNKLLPCYQLFRVHVFHYCYSLHCHYYPYFLMPNALSQDSFEERSVVLSRYLFMLRNIKHHGSFFCQCAHCALRIK